MTSRVGERFSVLIAGGGVAALEAVLALREHHGSGITIELVCPDREFTVRSLSVGEPFGSAPSRRLDLEEFCRRNGATLRADRVAEIWGEQQRVLLDSDEEVFYDALLMAFGARPYEALHGARAFRGPVDVGWLGELLTGLESGRVRSLAFAVPAEVRWSLPLYELALMTGRRLRELGISGVRLTFVTHETSPLSVFGKPGSDRIAKLLTGEGIELVSGRVPVRVEDDALLLDDGGRIEAAEVICLPALRVPDVPGLPQGQHGFVATDAEMRVDGLEHVWAAGDATWFPIKQGGLASQQADVAAACIAVAAGVATEVPPFRPVVRGALLTGGEPEFFRTAVEGESDPEFASHPLWWPPAKVAGARLAPYLAREWAGDDEDPPPPMEDLHPSAEPGADPDAEHRDALALSLRFADVDAAEGDLEQALRWLDVAERLNVTLPSEYADRRRAWQRKLSG